MHSHSHHFFLAENIKSQSFCLILSLEGESEDYAIPGALTALLSFFGTKAAKEAALAGAKEICKATGGMDYADYAESWGDWAEEHLAAAGRFTKKLAIAAGKAFCKAL